jgi:hypothetical protein
MMKSDFSHNHDYLRHIETTLPVESLRCNNETVWPYLRVRIRFEHVRQKTTTTDAIKIKHGFLKTLRRMAMNFWAWFGRYDVVILDDSMSRKLFLDGKRVNRFFSGIDALLRDRTLLYIENPAPEHYPFEGGEKRKLVSWIAIKVLTKIAMRVSRISCAIEGKEVFERFKNEYSSRLNLETVVKEFELQRRIMRFLFRRMSTKLLFVNTYFSYMPAIKAAHDLGIPVVEVQHGLFSAAHPLYCTDKKMDASFFPDTLLCYGEYERRIIKNSAIIDHVIAAGNWYLEQIGSQYHGDEAFLKQIAGYDKVIAVTTQFTVESALALFLRDAALRLPTVLFVFLLRHHPPLFYEKFNLPSNVIFAPDRLNCYEVLWHADLHTTVYSTCALEAPAIGVPNLLVDIDGLSSLHLEGIIDDDTTRKVENVTEYVDAVFTMPEKNDRKVVAAGRKRFAPHGEVVANFLQGVKWKEDVDDRDR